MCIISVSCKDETTEINMEKEKMLVQNVMNGVFNALTDRDWDSLRICTTDDMILLENGLIWNTDSLISAMEKYWEGYDLKYSLDFEKTEIQDSMAWVFYHNRCIGVKDTTQMKFYWVESGILKKEGKTWKLSFAHSTMVGQPEITIIEN